MTHDRELERLLDTWLSDGPTIVADRVIDGVAGRIVRQPQRPAWRLQPWRFPAMSTPLKLVLIGAALLAALGAGSAFLLGGAGPGPTPSPRPTPTPTASPSPTAPPSPTPAPTPKALSLHPFGRPLLTWNVVAPVGWSTAGSAAMTKASLGFGVIGVNLIGNPSVAQNTCDGRGVSPAPDQTVADIVAAIQAHDDWTASIPQEATLAGFTGVRLDVQLPAELGACSGGEKNTFVFAEPGGDGYYAQGPANKLRLWILGLGSEPPIVILRQSFAGTPADAVAEADAMIESSVIAP